MTVLTARLTNTTKTAPENISPTVVRSTRFELVDKSGKGWGVWSAEDPNKVMMLMGRMGQIGPSAIFMMVGKKTNSSSLTIGPPCNRTIGPLFNNIAIVVDPCHSGILCAEGKELNWIDLPKGVINLETVLNRHREIILSMLNVIEYLAAQQQAQDNSAVSTSEYKTLLQEMEEDELSSLMYQYLKNYKAHSDKVYVDTEGGHWVSENIDHGKYIKLEDGSLWEISPTGKIKSMLWLRLSQITVTKGQNPLYPYLLINTGYGLGGSVEAKLFSD